MCTADNNFFESEYRKAYRKVYGAHENALKRTAGLVGVDIFERHKAHSTWNQMNSFWKRRKKG
jgi:hypothetical protein